jgi:hypothetical protein
MSRLSAVIPAFVLLTACGGSHKGTYEVAAAGDTTVQDGDVSAADGLWNQRGDAAQLQAALDAYEAIAAAEPTNRHALERLVRGYYFLGDGHKTEMPDKLAAWDTAIGWGKKCMALNTDFVAHLDKGEDEGTAAVAFGAADVPCVYWTASALGKWSKASGMGATLKNVPTAKAWIAKVQELDNSYFYTATDRYWGAYYAAIPSFAGQDLDKSRGHLDTAVAANPDHFGNRLILASYWAVKTQDAAVFDEQVSYVLSNCPNTIEGIVPEQEAEQRKAQKLLDTRNDLFLDAGAAPDVTTPDCSAPAEETVEVATETTESETTEDSTTGETTDENTDENTDGDDASAE